MGPEEQLRVIKAVEIINRVAGTELDTFYFLQVYVINFLGGWGYTAEFNTIQ